MTAWDVTKEVAGFTKDLATAAAAITAIVVSVKGLATWKRQLKGNAGFDLAKRVLNAVYRFRDAIWVFRSPMMTAGELAAGLEISLRGAKEENPYPTKAQKDQAAEAGAFQSRWERLREAQMKVHDVSLEAQALWGRQFSDMFHELGVLSGELSYASTRYLGRHRRAMSEREDERITKVIWASGDDEDDFAKRLTATIEKIESAITPHLKI